VRRAVADGSVDVGEQLPPAAELGEALDVDRNTVLAAYRRPRDEGVLEFRLGRGARVAAAARPRASVEQAARGRTWNWGLNWTPRSGWAFLLRSGPALRLTLTNGRRITVGAADPAAALAALALTGDR